MDIIVAKVADWVSLVSFIISLIILHLTWKIKNYYVQRIRIPQLLEKIRSEISRLHSMINNYENERPSIELLLIDIGSWCKSLKGKVSFSEGSDLKEALRLIRKYEKGLQNRDSAFRIYKKLRNATEFISESQMDRDIIGA